MKKKTIGKEYIFTALILFVVLAVTMVLDSQLPGYHIVIKVIKKASVYSLVAVSMNLLNGFTGLFSLGQAGFMLLGAYSYAVLCIPVAKRAGVYQYFDGGIVKFSLPEIFASFLGDKVGSAVGMILALLVGGLIAAFFAYLIGLPVLRLKSDYLAIATLGFAEIMRTIIQWNAIGPLTNASNLLKGYPDFSSATAYLLLIGVFIACVVLLVNSTYGRAFKAIRDDEIAAEAMGINLARHKMISFVVSSFFCGVAGAMLAMCNTSVSSVSFTTSMTYQILLVVVVGGIGSVSGSVIAAFIYYASSEWWLRFLDLETYTASGARVPLLGYGFRMVVFSVLIMIVVLFFRKGIMGTREVSVYDDIRKIGRFFTRKSAAKGGDAQ